jgi:hypothetical protein
MMLLLGAFFFLFQRRLAETPEPRRQMPGPISVSERPPVSNLANLAGVSSVGKIAFFEDVRTFEVCLSFNQFLRQGIQIKVA